MKIPVIPLLVALVILAGGIYLFNSTSSLPARLDAPQISRLADLTGVETEIAISGDGNQYAAISSGDIWVWDPQSGSSRQITQTAEPESSPAWAPNGRRLTFTRRGDTWVVEPGQAEPPALFLAGATSLTWSSTARIAFIRDRSLWLADANGNNELRLVEADSNSDISFIRPRFSPDSLQVAFIRSALGLRGEVWIADILNGEASALVADRQSENPLDVGWILEGRHIVYLTDRSGTYALWHIDLSENYIEPLTAPLLGIPLAGIGFGVWKDRIVLPRHFIDSNVTLSDGTFVAGTADPEFEPAVSPNNQLVAYTIQKENKFEIWTATIHGENPTFRTLGREPRFAANGFQIVYTHTHLTGNQDIWKLDLRTNATEIVTDANEIDINPDWSPDGRTIVFASSRAGGIALWTVSALGGKRLRLNDDGYFPRYSPDGKSILFWSRNALWTVDAAGGNLKQVRDNVTEPAPGVWTRDGIRYYRDAEISGSRPIWPRFDVLKDGRLLVAPIEIRETSLWSVDLRFKEK